MSYEKAVKGACKPKSALPKSKYLEPIIAATWARDGAVLDVCRALSPRFREPNVTVVLKALVVLHMMIRNGSTDNVLSTLANSDVIRLRNVSAGSWEGYSAPENLQNYATYLDIRIKAYRELKHDAIRVQSESNRDLQSGGGSSSSIGRSNGGPSRSKTVAGRKLRSMTVEKGLLRETKNVQLMIDALVESRFYLSGLEDELTVVALQMLVKDLLVLFQACNEGVINLLESYFEMSRIDAEEALRLYRHFCKQTENVVEYLTMAKRLQNILHVSIPNLKHAPVSLAGALQEYLQDSNFEQNRVEYRHNKRATESNSSKFVNELKSAKPQTTSGSSATDKKNGSSNAGASAQNQEQDLMDFFSSIEEKQSNIFPSPSNNPFPVHNMGGNPFGQTGLTPFGLQGLANSGMQSNLQLQPTGFQAAGFPYFASNQPSLSPFPFNTVPTAQPTGPSSLFPTTMSLQPQLTGANPFRQSMAFPGMGQPSTPQSAMLPPTMAGVASMNQHGGLGRGSNPFDSQPHSATLPHFGNASSTTFSPPPRPATAPLDTVGSPNENKPIVPQQTGSRNPFGAPVRTPPPVPTLPTFAELGGRQLNIQPAGSNFSVQTTSTNPFPSNSPSFTSISQPTFPSTSEPSFMSQIASSFRPNPSSSTGESSSATTPSHIAANGEPMRPKTPPAVLPSSPTFSMAPQPTGLAPLKAFKPTSSFGSSLVDSLPAPSTQSTGLSGLPQPSGNPMLGSLEATDLPSISTSPAFSRSLGTSSTPSNGATLQALTSTNGMTTQSTSVYLPGTGGFGMVNPFRASTFPESPGSAQAHSNVFATPFQFNGSISPGTPSGSLHPPNSSAGADQPASLI